MIHFDGADYWTGIIQSVCLLPASPAGLVRHCCENVPFFCPQRRRVSEREGLWLHTADTSNIFFCSWCVFLCLCVCVRVCFMPFHVTQYVLKMQSRFFTTSCCQVGITLSCRTDSYQSEKSLVLSLASFSKENLSSSHEKSVKTIRLLLCLLPPWKFFTFSSPDKKLIQSARLSTTNLNNLAAL